MALLPFNRRPFNRPDPDLSTPAPLLCTFTASLDMTAQLDLSTFFSAYALDALSQKTIISISPPFSFYTNVDLLSKATLYAALSFSLAPSGHLAQTAILIKNSFVSLTFPDTLSCRLILGKNTFFSSTHTDRLLCRLSIAKNIYHSPSFTALLQGISQFTVLEALSFYLDVTIPPGSVLILDTEHYRLLLDDENILHLHSGHWPVLSRPLLSVDIDTAGTSLFGDITFTPRFL